MRKNFEKDIKDINILKEIQCLTPYNETKYLGVHISPEGEYEKEILHLSQIETKNIN